MSSRTHGEEVDVVLLTNMLPPYRIEFFAELARLCRLHVVADEAVNAVRSWEVPDELPFPCTILGNSGKLVKYKRTDLDYQEARVRQWGRGVTKALDSFRPRAVVSSELGMRSLRAARWCRKTRTPLVIWSEGTRYTESRQKLHRRLLRKYIIGSASAFWSNGRESADYLATFGADRGRIAVGITGISTDRFVDEARRLAPERTRLREENGLKGCVLLTVGSVSRRKGVAQYLEALERLADSSPGPMSVVFVGAGDMESEVRRFGESHPDIPVKVTGFLKPEQIHPWYAMGDVFVLPTLDDNWPLVTLEALASGLPQLISRYNGASADLPEMGPYGTVFDPLDSAGFAESLARLVGDTPARLADEQVALATAYYSPAGQAGRAHDVITGASR